jgi:hypothetical protein
MLFKRLAIRKGRRLTIIFAGLKEQLGLQRIRPKTNFIIEE